MESEVRRITIIKVRRQPKHDINDEIQAFSHALGLFNIRDREKSCFRIFLELLKAAKTNTSLTSDELAERANLSRATAVHHLANLIDRGLVTAHKRRYYLRVPNLSNLVKELKKDTERLFDDLGDQAKELDKELGLE